MIEIEALLQIPVRNTRTDPRSGAVIMNSMDKPEKLWFLERFPGLSQEEIAQLQMEYMGKIPAEFLDFLRITNGLNVMGRLLKIAGMDRDRVGGHRHGPCLPGYRRGWGSKSRVLSAL